MSDDRERVARELRRIRETVRDRHQAVPVRAPEPIAPATTPAPPTPPRPPDGTAVNSSWRAAPERPLGILGSWLRRLLGPIFDAQTTFNSRQVQLDNELIAYLEERLAATHRHYDEVLGIHGRHMAEIDERHLIVQEELVAHVHDLVKRIDLVLAEAEKGRLPLEFALRDLRARVREIEERLPRA